MLAFQYWAETYSRVITFMQITWQTWLRPQVNAITLLFLQNWCATNGPRQRKKLGLALVWRPVANAIQFPTLPSRIHIYMHVFWIVYSSLQVFRTTLSPLVFPNPFRLCLRMASFDQAPPGDVKSGDKIFRTKCAQCHTVEKGAGHKQGQFSPSPFLLINALLPISFYLIFQTSFSVYFG